MLSGWAAQGLLSLLRKIKKSSGEVSVGHHAQRRMRHDAVFVSLCCTGAPRDASSKCGLVLHSGSPPVGPLHEISAGFVAM